MPFFAVSILIQVALIVHVIRTGRNSLWIWVLALLPMAGPIAYIVAELLPELFGGRTARRAVANVRKTLDPTRDLRQAHKLARLTDSIDAKRRLAEQLADAGQFEGRHRELSSRATGLYEDDPHLLLGLARAQFADGEPAAARQTLDQLIAANPQFLIHRGSCAVRTCARRRG